MQDESNGPALSNRLRAFFSMRCNVDLDPADVAKALVDTEEPPQFASWLKDDLTKAILAGALTHDVLQELTYVAVPDEKAADEWLHELWAMWFPGAPYPEK